MPTGSVLHDLALIEPDRNDRVCPDAVAAAAIDQVWCDRHDLSEAFLIGPVTRWHGAKDLGLDVVKPNVHLERLAQHEGVTTLAQCLRIGQAAGRQIATVDIILWRACAEGILNSAVNVARMVPGRSATRPLVITRVGYLPCA